MKKEFPMQRSIPLFAIALVVFVSQRGFTGDADSAKKLQGAWVIAELIVAAAFRHM